MWTYGTGWNGVFTLYQASVIGGGSGSSGSNILCEFNANQYDGRYGAANTVTPKSESALYVIRY